MNDKYNIFLAAQIYPPETGGAAIYFSQLAHILKNSDKFNPVVIAGYLNNEPLIQHDDDIPVVRVATNNMSIINEIGFPLEFIDNKLDIRPDLIHLHPHLTGVEGLFRGNLADDIPIIYDYRGMSYKIYDVPYGDKKFYFSVMEKADKAIAERFRISEDEIYRAPAAVDVSKIGDRISDEKTNFRIIYVGEFHENKGMHIALEAALTVYKNYDIEFIIVGDGPDKRLKNLAENADENYEFVKYLGELPHKNALAEISTANVLLLPSGTEGDPRVVLEALSLETPVIGTDVGTIKKRIKDAGIIAQRNPKSFAEAIIKIYENEKRYIEALNNHNVSIITIEEMGNILENAYLDVLRRAEQYE